jgi:hypothetical protein
VLLTDCTKSSAVAMPLNERMSEPGACFLASQIPWLPSPRGRNALKVPFFKERHCDLGVPPKVASLVDARGIWI